MRSRWSTMASSAGTMALVAAGVLAVSAAGTAGGNARRLIGHPPWAAPGASRVAAAAGSQAGYVATGRHFRYAQAIITVPAQPCRPGAAPQVLYVALAGPLGSARAGLACPAAPAGRAAVTPAGRARWRPFVSAGPAGQAATPGGETLTGLAATASAASAASAHSPAGAAVAGAHPGHTGQVWQTLPPRPMSPGNGVFVSVYFNRVTHRVRLFVAIPGGASYTRSVAVSAATFYTEAQAVAGWPRPAPGIPLTPGHRTREARFLSGGFTTIHGIQGTFTGPWALTRWEATGNGKPSGRVAAAPGYLGADGTQRVIGAWDDAFGVWVYG
jgi:hypothetical protein